MNKRVFERACERVTKTNPFPKSVSGQGSGVWISDDVSEMRELFDHVDIKEGDICINYDFWSDELSESEESTWFDWYDDVLHPSIHSIINKFDYKIIEDMDGSGGGLFYGVYVIRPN